MSCRARFAENVLGKTLNQAALDGEPAYIFLDEVQNLPNSAPQLKHLVDMAPVRSARDGQFGIADRSGATVWPAGSARWRWGRCSSARDRAVARFRRMRPYLPHNGLGALKDREFWRGLRQFGATHDDIRQRAFAAFSERSATPLRRPGPTSLGNASPICSTRR